MRIVIEVDVSAEEIPLATHLFSALRAIADDVRTTNLRPVFEALIARLRDPAELDSVARDVRTLLGDGAGEGGTGEKGGARGSAGGSKSGSGSGEEKEAGANGKKVNEGPLDAFVAAFLHVVSVLLVPLHAPCAQVSACGPSSCALYPGQCFWSLFMRLVPRSVLLVPLHAPCTQVSACGPSSCALYPGQCFWSLFMRLVPRSVLVVPLHAPCTQVSASGPSSCALYPGQCLWSLFMRLVPRSVLVVPLHAPCTQ
ncbi:hypothetical protein CLOM_g22356, partial [Closterium sp. NIES-68]